MSDFDLDSDRKRMQERLTVIVEADQYTKAAADDIYEVGILKLSASAIQSNMDNPVNLAAGANVGELQQVKQFCERRIQMINNFAKNEEDNKSPYYRARVKILDLTRNGDDLSALSFALGKTR